MTTTHSTDVAIDTAELLTHGFTQTRTSTWTWGKADAPATIRHRLSSILLRRRTCFPQAHAGARQDWTPDSDADEIVRRERERTLLLMVREGVPF